MHIFHSLFKVSVFGLTLALPTLLACALIFLLTVQCFLDGQKETWVPMLPLPLTSVWSRISYATSSCLPFLIYKIMPTTHDLFQGSKEIMCEALSCPAPAKCSPVSVTNIHQRFPNPNRWENHLDLAEMQIPRCQTPTPWFLRYKRLRLLPFEELHQMVQAVHRLYSEKSFCTCCFQHKYLPTGPSPARP